MKHMKLFTFAVCFSCAATSMASTVIIKNTLNHPLGVKYQTVTGDREHVVKVIHRTILRPHEDISVVFATQNKNAGVVILAVKKNPRDSRWFIFPKKARAFKLKPGCWVSVKQANKLNKIVFTKEQEGAHNSLRDKPAGYSRYKAEDVAKHRLERIVCSTESD